VIKPSQLGWLVNCLRYYLKKAMGDVPWEMGYLLNDFLHISMCMNVAYLIIMLTYFMGSQCGAIKAIS
jgi:hypothetical protein